MAIDSMHDDEDNSVPYLESDDEDQENINEAINFGVQDDGWYAQHQSCGFLRWGLQD